jgi:hypothetical protein
MGTHFPLSVVRMPTTALCDRYSAFAADLLIGLLDPKGHQWASIAGAVDLPERRLRWWTPSQLFVAQ